MRSKVAGLEAYFLISYKIILWKTGKSATWCVSEDNMSSTFRYVNGLPSSAAQDTALSLAT